jgi:hypothetical protein
MVGEGMGPALFPRLWEIIKLREAATLSPHPLLLSGLCANQGCDSSLVLVIVNFRMSMSLITHIYRKTYIVQAPVAHACTPSYLGG